MAVKPENLSKVHDALVALDKEADRKAGEPKPVGSTRNRLHPDDIARRAGLSRSTVITALREQLPHLATEFDWNGPRFVFRTRDDLEFLAQQEANAQRLRERLAVLGFTVSENAYGIHYEGEDAYVGCDSEGKITLHAEGPHVADLFDKLPTEVSV